jgi:tetratricopeptide (TPR) repeat protein
MASGRNRRRSESTNMNRAVTALLLVFVATSSLRAQLDFGPVTKTDVTPPTELPEVLKPISGRSEAEEDRLTAAAHYAQGRLLHGRGKTAAALKHYQRAWRYDADSQKLLSELVTLAFDAKQTEVAARYAILAAERDPKDALLVRRLAIYLTDLREYARAVRMYEKSLEKDSQIVNGMPEDLGAATVYAELGRLYYLTEKYKAAAGTFSIVRKAVEDPSSHFDDATKKSIVGEAATTYMLWGEAFFEAARYDEAATAFRAANAAKEDKPLYALRLARIAIAQDKFDEARKQLDEYFAAKTDALGEDPYELLRKVLLKQAATPVAGHEQFVAKLREVHKEQPDNVPLAFALADALWTSGQFGDAVPLLTKTLATRPDSDRYAKLIEHHWQHKEYRELLAVAGQLAEPKSSLDAIEDLVLKMKQDEKLIKGCLALAREQAAVKDPKPKHGPILAAAILVREAGQLKEANELLQVAIELAPNKALDMRYFWAQGLFLASHHAKAVEMYRELLANKPRNNVGTSVQYHLSSALAMTGDTDAALDTIRVVLEKSPDAPRYESRVAWILFHGERYDAARAEYEKLLKKHGEKQDTETRQILRSARMALSNIALEQKDFPQAVEWLEQVLDEYPEDAGALNDLGYLWAERGLHLERSLRMTQKAVELEPKNHAYRDSLGWAYFQLGRYEEAVKELTAATTGNDDGPDGVLLEHLGDALAKTGKAAAAKQAWQRASEAFEKAGEKKKQQAVVDKLKSAP